MGRARRRAAAPAEGRTPTRAPEPGPRQRVALAALALLLLVVLAHLPALRGGFVWDDDAYVTRNSTLRSTSGLQRIWIEPGATPQYYPLTFTTFWIEVHLWGLQPFGFHLVNVLLHGLNAILLWRLLLRLTVPAAWLAAALFAVHPVHVESVAWVTERKNVLSGAFALGSALCFLRWTAASESGRWYVASLVLFAAALLSKTVTCILPPALLLALWWRDGAVTRRQAVRLLPYFALALAFALVTAWVERHHVGARGPEWGHTALERLLIAGRAVWFYAAKLAWPHPLIFNYPAWTIDPGRWWQLAYPLAAAACVAVLYLLRGRLGRGPLAAALYFGGALLPALGVIDFYAMRYSYVADHFAYLPSIGLLALAAAIARRAGDTRRLALGAAAAAVLLTLAGLTWAQSRSYRDLETLWRDVLDKNPSSWLAHNNLGSLLSERGHLEQALPHWQEALRLDASRPEVHENLGGAAKAVGRLDDAEAHYRDAIALDPTSPSAAMNLGVVLTAQGRPAEAVEAYRESLRLFAGNPTAHNDLGVALAALGRLDEAMRGYRAALALDPTFARAHNNLGLALARVGRIEEALAHDAEAVRLDPEMAEAHGNYAIALESLGRHEEALEEYRAVVRLAPSMPEAHYNLAAALAGVGRTDEAAEAYREALRLRPEFPQAQAGLARLRPR